ncbi:PQQ-binding-like beta-propeller repeat protein [Streptomyces sp. NPDC003077]|uniref:outer membrane protein assembly factor BamB family protein n=1 Tax=Streptomyces sp. NPDC003077 TaxID=3154443 RepID=UPI00339F41EA
MIGETLWERPLHQRGSASAFAVAEGSVVVHERRSRLVCLDAADGAVRWDVPLGTWPRDLVVAGDRCLALPQRPAHLSCLDPRTGAVVWQVALPHHSGHVVPVADTVLVGGWRGYTPLAAFDLRDGSRVWRTPTPVRTALPLPWGGGVLLGYDREAWLIDPRDGGERARWRLPEPLADGEPGPVFTALGPDRCLARCGRRSVVALHLPSGRVEELLRHDADLLPEAPRLVGGALWLRESRAGYLVADPADGSPLWRVDTEHASAPGVVRTEDGFVVAGEHGVLFRVGRDGRVRERSWVARRIGGLRDMGDGKAVVTTKGTLRAVACAPRPSAG